MPARRSSLTGRWSGAYRYPGDAAPETVFEAQITEDGDGNVTGFIREPDTTRGTGIVGADIHGAREGVEVTFLKSYGGSGGRHHVVTYDGNIDEAFERIEGAWNIPDQWSGTFFMTRDGDEEGRQ